MLTHAEISKKHKLPALHTLKPETPKPHSLCEGIRDLQIRGAPELCLRPSEAAGPSATPGKSRGQLGPGSYVETETD